jgi:lycopene cyclase domain-containing protein
MTYFSFLLLFLILPLAALLARAWRHRADERLPWKTLILAAVIALVYTTPWDNYLVANAIWWYDGRLVAGLTLGWVPLEEYLFFILQPLLVGMWLITLERRVPVSEAPIFGARLRQVALVLVAIVWIGGWTLLLSDGTSGRYLGLVLVWAIPPLALQFAFGADILWRSRRTLGLAIISSTLYLSAADAIAIASGTWTINPAFSSGIRLAGILPVEEFIFFLLTSTLISSTVTLVETPQSVARMVKIASFLNDRARATRAP